MLEHHLLPSVDMLLCFCSKQWSRNKRLLVCTAVVKPPGADEEETMGNRPQFGWFL